jgi:hypothetical protein
LRNYGGDKQDELVNKIADIIAPLTRPTAKFIDFMLEFLPPAPSVRPYPYAQHNWEKGAMKKTLGTIYKYRSDALHGGRPFPAPMCEPPYIAGENGELTEIPSGLATSMKGGVWVAKDTPMLLNTFEYIVRNTILNWWKSIVPEYKAN